MLEDLIVDGLRNNLGVDERRDVYVDAVLVVRLIAGSCDFRECAVGPVGGDPFTNLLATIIDFLNAAACRTLWDERPDYLRILVDHEHTRLGFEPSDDTDPDAYAVSGAADESGGDLQLKKAVRRLGIDIDALEETTFLALERSGDLAIADLSDLVAASTEEPGAQAHQSKDDIEYYCGYCGKGPWARQDRVRGHHDRMSHPSEVVVRTTEPDDETVLEHESAPTVEGEPRERIRSWLEAHTPEYRFFKTEDIAIECDLPGNDTDDMLDRGLSGFEIARDGQLWRIDPVEGEE
ncbi:hypothetical protein [Haloarcula sp. 1CSR25-25]|uniref:hypothetical protein n=1 Tax=Haloarcula sp. 1CSR25-25 TaxID=2862545 RepID=UPI00289432B5|nr:hypothetical protein [Haloarcula sp. 1CSR25-25]MDT3434646.1 hypothetical protein [Haloarcula sp. 1CSR25-25]